MTMSLRRTTMSDETVKELSQFLKDRNAALLSGDVEKTIGI